MTHRRWAFVIAGLIVAFLIPELWAYFSGAPTLSQTVWAATDGFGPLSLIGCFALGLLCGHWWFPRRIFMPQTEHLMALFNEKENGNPENYR